MASGSFAETPLAAHTVGEALDARGASWHVGGSVASSVQGIPLATQGADIVATLRPGQGRALAALLAEDFDGDGDTAEQAIRDHRSFNVTHPATMFKVYIFVSPGDAYSRRAMDSRLVRVVSESPPLSLPVATAEDTVAYKLFWFRRADERSDWQWRDLVGVLKTLGTDLDPTPLRLACADLGVGDLVDRALEAAGGQSG